MDLCQSFSLVFYVNLIVSIRQSLIKEYLPSVDGCKVEKCPHCLMQTDEKIKLSEK